MLPRALAVLATAVATALGLALAPATGLVLAAPPALADTASDLPLHAGQDGPLVALAQARLAWLGYPLEPTAVAEARFDESTEAAVRALQAKWAVTPTPGELDRRTWDLLRRTAGPVGSLPADCRTATSLCADTRARVLRYVRGGRVLRTVDARFGLPGMQTTRGTFRVKERSRDAVSTRYGTPMPYALFFHGDEAVHYSPAFARDGYAGGSHGCVGIRDRAAAAWLFDQALIGTRVVVY